MKQTGDWTLSVTSSHLRCDLHFSEREARDAILALKSGEINADQWEQRLSGAQTPVPFAEFLYAVGLLHEAEALEYPLDGDEIVVVPQSHSWNPAARDQAGEKLSRFARARFAGNALIVESPLAMARVEIRSAQVAALFVTELTATGNIADTRILGALALAGLLSARDDRLPGWTHGEAEMHGESRFGRRGNTVEQHLAEAVRQPPTITESVPLPGGAKRADSLDDLLRRRRSIRTNGVDPITAQELATLLERSSWEDSRVLPNGLPGIVRAYASGGDCHSLDVYVAVSRCDGVEPGLFLYDRAQNCLGRVGSAEIALQLVREARIAAGENDDGQVLLILASDFGPVLNRYEAVGYSLILKEVGAALHTIQLVAADMNLATCPIGRGDSLLFASAVGASPFVYTSVGEMLIGSAP
jgi:SagB-type dehydrogenase family enzyme